MRKILKNIFVSLGVALSLLFGALVVHAVGVIVPGGQITIVHPNGSITFLNATTSSNVGRGTALSTAVGLAVTGDVIKLSDNSTFDVGTRCMDLGKGETASISLIGGNNTIIRSGCTNDIGFILAPGIGSTTIANVSIVGTDVTGTGQYPIGGQALVKSYELTLRNVTIDQTGGNVIDGLFLQTSGNSTTTMDNFRCYSSFDCINYKATTKSLLTIYDSIFNSFPSTAWPNTSRNIAISANSGTTTIYNTQFTAIGGSSSTGILVGSGNAVNLIGDMISTDPTVGVDISNTGSTVNVSPSTFYTQSKVTGTITRLSLWGGDVVDVGGKIGIATSSPLTLLSVAGTITANNINATSTTASSTFSGTVDGHFYQHCTTITGSAGTSTTISDSTFTKVNLDTVIYDADKMANVTNSTISVPSWAKNVSVIGHIDWPVQTNNNGVAATHLWRNGGPTLEALYHVDTYYPVNGSPVIGTLGVAPPNPIVTGSDVWTLVGFQTTGANVALGTQGQWLTVCFYP